MKIKKLLPNEVQEKSLGYKDYKKVLKPSLKKMENECNSPETATDFFLKTDYEFSDMPGKKMGIIIPGKQAGAWLKMAKEEVKQDKKFTLIGKCYINSKEDGTLELVLLPKKGGAKKNLVNRQIPKFALKGLPYSLVLGENTEVSKGEEEEESMQGNQEQDDDALSKKKLMDARMAKMDEQMTKIKKQLKIS